MVHGDANRALPHVLNVSIPGVNSEAALIALKDIAAVSNGSACTSASYKGSHVLEAMGLEQEEVSGALRFSWSHMTESFDWDAVANALRSLQ